MTREHCMMCGRPGSWYPWWYSKSIWHGEATRIHKVWGCIMDKPMGKRRKHVQNYRLKMTGQLTVRELVDVCGMLAQFVNCVTNHGSGTNTSTWNGDCQHCHGLTMLLVANGWPTGLPTLKALTGPANQQSPPWRVPLQQHGALNCVQCEHVHWCFAWHWPWPWMVASGITMVQVCLADEQGPEYYLKLMDAVDVILTRLWTVARRHTGLWAWKCSLFTLDVTLLIGWLFTNLCSHPSGASVSMFCCSFYWLCIFQYVVSTYPGVPNIWTQYDAVWRSRYTCICIYISLHYSKLLHVSYDYYM